MRISKDYRRYNAEDEAKNPDSVLSFYKKAIALRKSDKELVYGTFKTVFEKNQVYCYERELDYAKNYVELNLSPKSAKRPIDTSKMELVLSTKGSTADTLRAFEGNVYKVR